jgi:hypothetical protein
MAAFDPFSAFSAFFGKLTPNPTTGPDVIRAAVTTAQTPEERQRYVDQGLHEADKDRFDRRVLVALGVVALAGLVCLQLHAG